MARIASCRVTTYKSQSQVSELLGVTTRQVHNLTEKGMPRRVENGRPKYPWPDALKWYIAFKVSVEAAKANPVDFEAARARKMAADAELAEMEVARTRGEQVPIDAFRIALDEMSGHIRAQLLAASGRYSARLVGATTLPAAQRALDAVMRDVLNELKVG
jgi:phage terminase Nu1 subunit (DNA packaging protein)